MNMLSPDRPFSRPSMPKRTADPLESPAKVAAASEPSDDVASDADAASEASDAVTTNEAAASAPEPNRDDEAILFLMIGEFPSEHEFHIAYRKEAVAFGLADDWDAALDQPNDSVLDKTTRLKLRRRLAKIMCASNLDVEFDPDSVRKLLARFDADKNFIDSPTIRDPVDNERPVRIVATFKIDFFSFFL